MHAEIVTTGTELLLGVITDTNSTYIARQLCDIGMNLYFITSAGDNEVRVAQVISAGLDRSDVIITTGGLGPTVDDITREAVATATSRALVLDPQLVTSIETFFRQRGFSMTDNNRRQARIPEGAIPLENPVGTAPCFIVEDPRGIVISLPGVPREMKYMMANAVLPYLRKRFDLKDIIKARTLKASGIGESTLDSCITDLETSSNPTIGLAAHPGQIDVRITAKADSVTRADAMLDDMEARVRERIGDVIYGVDDKRLESAVVEQLLARTLTIAVAEENTGGLISGRLNDADLKGCTFLGGWILPEAHTWTTENKNPSPGDHEPRAVRLAAAVRKEMGADIGLAAINTGPEDTRLVAVHGNETRRSTLRFRGHESYAHQWIASLALDMVRRMCLGLPERAQIGTRPAPSA